MSKFNMKLYFLVFLILLFAFVKNSIVQFLGLFFSILGIFYLMQKNMPSITKLSKDNIKVKNLKTANIFTLVFILAITLVNIIFPKIFGKYLDITNLVLITLFFLYFGNISTRIPFNRYFGLRLPWTVTDEETWYYAHRLLGYISLPACLIMLILGYFINVEIGICVGVLLIVAIPTILSYKFYHKKG